MTAAEWSSLLLVFALLSTGFGLTAVSASAALLLKAWISAAAITATLSFAIGVVSLF